MIAPFASHPVSDHSVTARDSTDTRITMIAPFASHPVSDHSVTARDSTDTRIPAYNILFDICHIVFYHPRCLFHRRK